MGYIFEEKQQIRFVGFEKTLVADKCIGACPAFRSEVFSTYVTPVQERGELATETEAVVQAAHVGEFEIAHFDDCEPGQVKYMIAGIWQEGPVPEGMTTLTVPAGLWAKVPVDCVLANGITMMGDRICGYWMSGQHVYEASMKLLMEYVPENAEAGKDQGGIWIPVKEHQF